MLYLNICKRCGKIRFATTDKNHARKMKTNNQKTVCAKFTRDF